MIVGGVALALAGWQLTRYLRTPRQGFTSAPDVRKSQGSQISELLTDHVLDKATLGDNREVNGNSW